MPVCFSVLLYQYNYNEVEVNLVKLLAQEMMVPYFSLIGILAFLPMVIAWINKLRDTIKRKIFAKRLKKIKDHHPELQMDVNNRYSKPTYKVERQLAHFFGLSFSCFLWISFYPVLAPVFMLWAFVFLINEVFTISKITFIRKQLDIYHFEFLDPVLSTAKLAYLLKVAMSTVELIYLAGK